MKRIQRLLISSLFIGLLTACASEGVNTVDRLTTSMSNDGESRNFVNLNYPQQTRILAINGQLPVPGAGSSCLASSARVANSIICFSPNNKTHILEKEYKYTGTDGPAELRDIQSKLTKLQTNFVQLLQQDAADGNNNNQPDLTDKAQGVVDSAAKISADLQQKNVFIFRWTSGSESSSGGNAGSLFNVRGADKEERSGLVIVAGLKVSQLMIAPNDIGSFSTLPGAAKIATLTMSAEHYLYFTEASFGAALDAVLKGDLADIKGDLSPQTKIAFNAYAGIGSAQENQGLFSAPTVTQVSLADAYNQGNPGQVFYATMTDIGSLKKDIGVVEAQ